MLRSKTQVLQGLSRPDFERPWFYQGFYRVPTARLVVSSVQWVLADLHVDPFVVFSLECD